jgi:hypothetical protein
MKKSYITLGGILLFLCLLIGNWILKISPENNTTLGALIVAFLIVFFVQKRKEKRV